MSSRIKEVRERPILFNDAMVRAILAGTKTQTRRPVARENAPSPGYRWAQCLCREIDPADTPCHPCEGRFGECPFGAPGDLLWVREAHHVSRDHAPDTYPHVCYRADGAAHEHDGRAICPQPDAAMRDTYRGPWTPSIHMPRWASRLTLRVTEVRVERLQSISEGDARAEGVRRTENGYATGGVGHVMRARDAFAELWDDVYGSWDANPWVWVVEFERVEKEVAHV